MRVEGVPQEDRVGNRTQVRNDMEQAVREESRMLRSVCTGIDCNRKDVQMIIDKIAPLDASKILKYYATGEHVRSSFVDHDRLMSTYYSILSYGKTDWDCFIALLRMGNYSEYAHRNMLAHTLCCRESEIANTLLGLYETNVEDSNIWKIGDMMSRIKAIAGDKCFNDDNIGVAKLHDGFFTNKSKAVDVVKEKNIEAPRWVRNFRPEQMNPDLNYRDIFRCKYVGTGVMCNMLGVGRTVFSHEEERNRVGMSFHRGCDIGIKDKSTSFFVESAELQQWLEQRGVNVNGFIERSEPVKRGRGRPKKTYVPVKEKRYVPCVDVSNRSPLVAQVLPAAEDHAAPETDGFEITVDVPGVLKRNSELVDKNNVLFRQNEALRQANVRLKIYTSILFVIAALSTLVGLYAH